MLFCSNLYFVIFNLTLISYCFHVICETTSDDVEYMSTTEFANLDEPELAAIISSESSSKIYLKHDQLNLTIDDQNAHIKYENHGDKIWNNLMNQEEMFGSGEDSTQSKIQIIYKPTDPPFYSLFTSLWKKPLLALKMPTRYSTTVHMPDETTIGETNIYMMKKIFEEMFLEPRSDEHNADLKEKTRKLLIERLNHYTLETQTQEFFAKAPNGTKIRGVNVIGVLPGKNRGRPGDGIILIGAHYDTTQNCPGVDDNGSGVVALLEVARLLSPRIGQFNNTIMLVAFDLEEKGILGSLAFVNQYLIPEEIVSRQSKFIGAYILDMVMNFDSGLGSQIMPLDVSTAAPDAATWVRRNGYTGDFLSVLTRRVIDWPLYNAFKNIWEKDPTEKTYKLLQIDPPMPRNEALFSNFRFRSFTRSDHAAFWYHKNQLYKETLNAVLLTDMGPWRGTQRACYHEFCDDKRMLTPANMAFLKKVTDTLAQTISKLVE